MADEELYRAIVSKANGKPSIETAISEIRVQLIEACTIMRAS